MKADKHLYAVAIGSNRLHGRHGRPAAVVAAAVAELDRHFTLFDAAPILLNPASGGAGREFANSAAIVECRLAPLAMLDALKAIERSFGRRPGRRWGSRVLDLDLLAWSGGRWRSRTLTIPHRQLGWRTFALLPLAAVAPRWRLHGPLTAPHLLARLGKRASSP